MQLLISGLATMIAYAVVVAGVVKLFQIASDLGEIKEALLEIKHNALDIPGALGQHSHQIPDSLSALARPHNQSSQPIESPR